jgi:hypothetical protein
VDFGTGLGMWVVAQLTQRHRGHVNVWSTQLPGASGTVFSVFLPLADAAQSSGNAAVPTPRAPKNSSPAERCENLDTGARLTARFPFNPD